MISHDYQIAVSDLLVSRIEKKGLKCMKFHLVSTFYLEHICDVASYSKNLAEN